MPTRREAVDPYQNMDKSVSSTPSVTSKSLSRMESFRSKGTFESYETTGGTKRWGPKEDVAGKIIELEEESSYDLNATGGMFNMLQKTVSDFQYSL